MKARRPRSSSSAPTFPAHPSSSAASWRLQSPPSAPVALNSPYSQFFEQQQVVRLQRSQGWSRSLECIQRIACSPPNTPPPRSSSRMSIAHLTSEESSGGCVDFNRPPAVAIEPPSRLPSWTVSNERSTGSLWPDDAVSPVSPRSLVYPFNAMNL